MNRRWIAFHLAAGLVASGTAIELPAPAAASELLAFPGAVGHGRNAKGGRGGTVHLVSSLADSGPGTLRACVQASGPRTCIFAVSGTIILTEALRIRNPYLTIAGQSAPGGGVQLRNDPQSPHARSPMHLIDTHDIIVRHLRVRPGPGPNPTATDAISIEDSHDVILDHVSLQWASDENIGASGEVYNLTVQWSILAEGLDPHSKGALLCNSEVSPCDRMTLIGNLFAHNHDRNPNIDLNNGQFEFINNTVYNVRTEYVEIHGTNGGNLVNVIGNSFLRGPSTISDTAAIRYYVETAAGPTRLYQAGNIGDVRLLGRSATRLLAERPVATLSVEPLDTRRAFELVVQGAGALPRDAVDRRIVDQLEDRTGGIIREPGEVGGWSELTAGRPELDSDRDGMPDDWERARDLDPFDPDDRHALDGLGYSALETFLAERAASLLP